MSNQTQTYWINPSKSEAIWDRQLNKHIQPGEKVYQTPWNQNIKLGKLLKVEPMDTPKTEAKPPVKLVSSLEIEKPEEPVVETSSSLEPETPKPVIKMPAAKAAAPKIVLKKSG